MENYSNMDSELSLIAKDQTHPQTQSRLMQLPGELRSKIYRECLSAICEKNMGFEVLEEPFFTSTCRKIQAEAMSIYFAEHQFVLLFRKAEPQNPFICQDTLKWLRKLGRQGKYMQHVKVEYKDDRGAQSELATVQVQKKKLVLTLQGVVRTRDWTKATRMVEQMNGSGAMGVRIEDEIQVGNILLSWKALGGLAGRRHIGCGDAVLQAINRTTLG